MNFPVISVNCGRRAFLREIVLVGDVANDRSRFIALCFGIEGQFTGGDAGDLFFRKATAEKIPGETGASLSVLGVAIGGREAEGDGKDGRQRLKRNLIELAHPGNHEQFDAQDRERPIQILAP